MFKSAVYARYEGFFTCKKISPSGATKEHMCFSDLETPSICTPIVAGAQSDAGIILCDWACEKHAKKAIELLTK